VMFWIIAVISMALAVVVGYYFLRRR